MALNLKQRNTKPARSFFRPGEPVKLTYGLLGQVVSTAGPGLFNIKHADGRVARYRADQFSRA